MVHFRQLFGIKFTGITKVLYQQQKREHMTLVEIINISHWFNRKSAKLTCHSNVAVEVFI